MDEEGEVGEEEGGRGRGRGRRKRKGEEEEGKMEMCRKLETFESKVAEAGRRLRSLKTTWRHT